MLSQKKGHPTLFCTQTKITWRTKIDGRCTVLRFPVFKRFVIAVFSLDDFAGMGFCRSSTTRGHVRLRDRGLTGNVVLMSNRREFEVVQGLSHSGNLSPSPRPSNAD